MHVSDTDRNGVGGGRTWLRRMRRRERRRRRTHLAEEDAKGVGEERTSNGIEFH